MTSLSEADIFKEMQQDIGQIEALHKMISTQIIEMAFHNKYVSCDLNQISRLKPEMTFYFRLSRLIRQMQAAGLPFCKPILATSAQSVRIQGLYDLSLARQMVSTGISDLSNQVVTNDFTVLPNERIFLVTGPNQGGKTTFLRSIGTAQLLMQTGCLVPAQSAVMVLADQIYTHFPQEEILGVGLGRLGEEAERMAQIIRHANNHSLVLLNETFSSTRRVDGYFLSRELIKTLLAIRCTCIFVTHLSELAADIETMNDSADQEGSSVNLVAGIIDQDGLGLTGSRTFKVTRFKPNSYGYSQDLVRKHGLTGDQLTELLRRRGFVSDQNRNSGRVKS